MVVCRSSRASYAGHQHTTNYLVGEGTHHPPAPHGVLLGASPLEDIRNFVTPATGGEFHALIASPGQL